jgi:hypothetical protein
MPEVGLDSTIAVSSHLKRAEVVTAQHDNAAGVRALTSALAAEQVALIRFEYATDAECANTKAGDTRRRAQLDGWVRQY